MEAADKERLAILANMDWLREAPGRSLVRGKRVELSPVAPSEQQREAERPAERQPAAATPDRQAVERAALERDRQRKIQDARSTIEQIGGQIAGMEAKIRLAETQRNFEAKRQWMDMKERLRQLQKTKQDELAALTQKKAA